MDMQPVRSSNIAAIGYDRSSETLRIKFKSGDVFEYYGVPEAEYDHLMAASSKGSYANKHIYKRYRQRQIH